MITAFHRRLLSQFLRNNRLVYEGLLRELEQNYRLTLSDWSERLDQKLLLEVLIPFLSHPVRHILHYRMLGFGWREIGKRMEMSAKQAKSRFYYGVQQAYEKVNGLPVKPGNKEPADHE